MNLKKAKAFRGLVKEMVKKGVIKEPWVQYVSRKHNKTVDAMVYDEAGKKVKGKQDVTRNQVRVDPMSPRGVYLRMKKSGPAAVLNGLA